MTSSSLSWRDQTALIIQMVHLYVKTPNDRIDFTQLFDKLDHFPFNVPSKVLHRICFEHLEPHELFQLSQTCRVLRNIINCVWDVEVAKLSRQTRADFWKGLAYSSPYHCTLGHPNKKMMRLEKIRRPWIFWPPMRHIGNEPFPELIYSPKYEHVQVALKLSRLLAASQSRSKPAALKQQRLDDFHRSLLDQLLEGYEKTWISDNGFPRDRYYGVTPKIIGHRLLVHKEWQYSNNERKAMNIHDFCNSCCPLWLCDHFDVWEEKKVVHGNRFKLFLSAVDKVFKKPDGHILTGCPHCHTDFEIKRSPGHDKLEIHAWTDYGGEWSPWDTVWMADEMTGRVRHKNPCTADVDIGYVREAWIRHHET